MFCSCCYYGIVVAVGLSKFLLLCFLLLLLFMSKPITVELEVTLNLSLGCDKNINIPVSASDSEESCFWGGENSVSELCSREGQDAFHGPGDGGGDGVGGQHAPAGVVG